MSILVIPGLPTAVPLTETATLVTVNDPVPEDDDVVAGGWGAFFLVALVVATALLMFSFTKQLRKAQAAKDAGVYGDEPADRLADLDDESPAED